ncbi:MAG TPA: hypothetical protein VFS30_06425 [Dehalococcoidia bacterium]|nr:hypothetical protein [Dehalococcoidia bacterium]
MLRWAKRHTHTETESTAVVEPEADLESDRPAVDAGPLVDVHVLGVERTYRPQNRQADYLRLLYAIDGHARELIVAVPWESLAQLRAELERSGHRLDDAQIAADLIVPWAVEQVAAARGALPGGEVLTLEFTGGPHAAAVRDLLLHSGFLPAGPPPPVTADRPWVWEG